MQKFKLPVEVKQWHCSCMLGFLLLGKFDCVPHFCVVSLLKGDSTCGQRAIYHGLGLTGIPIINVNNNCATGSTALFMARQLVEGGELSCSGAG